eukprot:scaffold58805_cov25-Tisochrysis_lutea.AAC.2
MASSSTGSHRSIGNIGTDRVPTDNAGGTQLASSCIARVACTAASRSITSLAASWRAASVDGGLPPSRWISSTRARGSATCCVCIAIK